MIAYNGGTITKVLLNNNYDHIYVTDTVARAMRYANAQATKQVNAAMNQEQAPNTVILHVECEPNFIRRDNDHNSLDTCEAVVKNFKITKAVVKSPVYKNVLYGSRWSGYKTFEQAIEIIRNRGIEVEII